MSLRLSLPLLLGLALSLVARSAEQPLVFDAAESRVEVAVKASFDAFTAKLTRFEPAVMVDDLERVTAARLTFHFRDLVTGKEKRDAAMHRWQETDRFPDGEFVLSALEPAPDGGFQARGRLTFHGVTRDVQFPVSIRRDGPRVVIDGTVPVDTRDHGLPIIRMFGLLKVDPLVHVRFHLAGRRVS